MHSKLKREELFKRFNQSIPCVNSVSITDNQIDVDIYFEPLSMLGLEEMHKYSIDERLYEFFEFLPFKTIEDTKNYIKKLQKRMSGAVHEKTAQYWFVRRKSDNYLIGTAALTSLDYNRSSLEWGYGVDPELWGQGYILQIQELLKHFAFEVLKINRLHGISMIDNKRTRSSVLAAGMKYEGTSRQFYCKNGRFIDGWNYSMLREEYLSQKMIIEGEKTNTYTEHDIIKIISSVLDEEEITMNSTMNNTTSWDSLNHMTIMVALYEKTKIHLSPIQIANATSVLAITKLIIPQKKQL